MNAMQMAANRRAAGMGDAWDWLGQMDGTVPWNPNSPAPAGSGWQNQIIPALTNFGSQFLAAWQNRGIAQTGQHPLFAPPGFAPNANHNPNAYATGAISERGIQIGSTTLSWPVLGLGVAAIFLLQSRGFSRR